MNECIHQSKTVCILEYSDVVYREVVYSDALTRVRVRPH